jgi:hypothetical protein
MPRTESFVDWPGLWAYTYQLRGNYLMQGEKAEQWRGLCEQAAVEQDPQKLMRLIEQIDRLLED